MPTTKQLLLFLLFAAVSVAPVQAGAGHGEIAVQSRASVSISVSVTPRFKLRARQSAAGASCIESNLPANFTVIAEATPSAIDREPRVGSLADDQALASNLGPCGEWRGHLADTTIEAAANGRSAPVARRPVILIIHPE